MLAILTSFALGSTITGRIDLPKDRPAEHIQIRLMQDEDDPATLATSEIAADGTFRFDLEELPWAAVFKLDSGWLWLPGREQIWRRTWHEEGEPYVLHAFLGAAIHGRVIAAEGTPLDSLDLSGARIGIQSKQGHMGWSEARAVSADLTFAFDNLDPAPSYSIRLEKDGFIAAWQRVWGTAPGKEPHADLVAWPAARLRGHVFAVDGAPLAGVAVTFVPPEHASHFARMFEEQFDDLAWNAARREELVASGMGAITGNDGAYSIERAFPDDAAMLSVRLEGFRVESRQLGALRAGELRTDLDFTLAPHAELQLTAVDESGRPIPNAELTAFDPDGETGVELSSKAGWLRDALFDGVTSFPYTDARGMVEVRLRRDVKRVLLDVRCGELVGFSPEPVSLEDGKIVKLSVTLRRAGPVCIQFPSRLQPGGSDDVRVFDERGWMRTSTLEMGWPHARYPWNAHADPRPAPQDSLPGIRLAPLPAGRYTVKALDATGKVHSKSFDLDPLHPRSIDLNE